MVNIVVSILSKIGSNSGAKGSTVNKLENVSDLFKPKPNDKKSWYLSFVPVAEEMTEEFDSICIQPSAPVKVTNEQQLILEIKSISLIIESGGLASLPLVKLESSLTARLYDYKLLKADCSLISNYFNENNFAWEPLIEPSEGKPIFTYYLF